MVAWWTSRSIRAAATMASPRISPHCSKPRLRGDDDRAAFVAARDEREEQVGGLALERAGSRPRRRSAGGSARGGAARASSWLRSWASSRRRDPLLGGREGDAVAALAGFDRRARSRRCVLPVPGGPRKQTLARSSIQASWARWSTSGRSARGLGGPVEVLERLQRGEGGVADAHPGAGGVAGEDLGLEQRLEEAARTATPARARAARRSARAAPARAAPSASRAGTGSRSPALRLAHAHSSA